uniref:Uncharacterized protein n=1 Tax=Spiroplasma kunkelii TaxID=47834 RepID=Q6XYZ8_SPIKU|nr:hypothetical protein [Spiroplasma kunkelii CR2-3x]
MFWQAMAACSARVLMFVWFDFSKLFVITTYNFEKIVLVFLIILRWPSWIGSKLPGKIAFKIIFTSF